MQEVFAGDGLGRGALDETGKVLRHDARTDGVEARGLELIGKRRKVGKTGAKKK